MKSFFATLLLFLLTVGLVVFNAFYINRIASNAEEMISALPESIDQQSVRQAEEMLAYWKKHEHRVSLSANYNIADRVTEQATLLVVCAQSGDVYGFQSARALLLDAIDDMRRPEAPWKFNNH